MSKIILVTGGSRSGKSSYAQRLAESLAGPRAFVATCPYVDDEMRARIARHQRDRAGADWRTIEEPRDLVGVLARNDNINVHLVDCVTLWVNNLLYDAGQRSADISEDEMTRRAREVLDACGRRDGTVIFVTNEVGMSIVPDNPLSRKYRDLVGRCNQALAAGADVVTLVTCGIPMNLKGA